MTTAGVVHMEFDLDFPGVGVERTQSGTPTSRVNASVAPRVGGGRIVRVGSTVVVAPTSGRASINKTTGTGTAC